MAEGHTIASVNLIKRRHNMTIRSRTSKKTGLLRHTAIAIKKQFGQVIEQKTRTFDEYDEAVAWRNLAKAYMNNQLWLTGTVTECTTVKEAAAYYQKMADSGIVHLGKTEYSNLNVIVQDGSPLSDLMLCELDENSIYEFSIWRRGTSRSKPKVDSQTTHNNLATLKMLLSSLKTLFKLKINPSFMEDKDLKKLLSREKLTRKSQPRDRRPEDYELEEIYNEFETRQQSKRVKIPYTLVYLITLCTGLRENEIVNLRAEDLNYSSKFIYLRTFKNDGGLEAENNWVKQPLVRGSFELLTTYLKSTGIKKGKIFNFKAKSISAAFRRVRKHLEIEDLRWHDLMREAISQLIDKEVSKLIVKKVSRHKDDRTLQVNYSHPDIKAVHDAIPEVLSAHEKMSFLEGRM